ncbi:MAG: universal stress protein [Alphaproteobacteria bacterium]|nr:universal stress protein [Alphaproteobacteria bacterium]
MKILLPIDGSGYTKRMLAYLGAHDEVFGAADEYTLLYVATPIPPRARAAVGKEMVDKFQADETTAACKGVLPYFKQKGWKNRVVTKVGNAGDEIAKYATAGKFDLVVMGSHGHGALASLVMGSTSQRVLAACDVPVLLIR